MKVLADSSTWIDFFRRKSSSNQISVLLSEDLVVTNSLILAEIVPALKVKKRKDIVSLLEMLECSDMDVDWNEVVEIQMNFVGTYKYFVGIPDILIFQNALQNNYMLYSFDADINKLCDLFGYKYFK